MNESTALVMLSGGVDSAVALYLAASRKYKTDTITFDYSGRTNKERDTALRLAELKGRRHLEIDVSFLKELDTFRTKSRNKELRNAPGAYIPSRNVVFYGIASSFAEILNAKYVVGGHNKDDALSFRDASVQFFDQFNKTTAMGLYTGAKTGRVILPLSNLTKAEVILLGSRLRVPFEMTWSCYVSGERPCGKCRSCLERAKAFEVARISDPLAFQETQ